MREIKCNLCGSNSKNELFFKNGFRIVQCSNCGLVFVDPQPEEEEISQFYNEHQKFYMSRYPKKIKSKLRDAKREINRIKKIIKHKNEISLLDIGCSCGFLLKVAQDNDWDASGIDICEWEIEYARKEFGVNAEVRNFPGSDLPERKFDVITMFDLIEHLTEPLKGLRECFTLFRDEGILIIGSPDFGHPKAKKEGRNWGHLKPPEHLFYFSITTLKSLAEKAGFKYKGSFLKVPWKDGIKAVFQKVYSYEKIV